MDENTSGISGEIQKMILDKLNTFNRGKTSDKGRYYILLPTSKTLYYTLWFFTPSATYHPTVYLANLDLNAISSVNKAIKMVSNSFLPLFITTDIKDSPDNGDDIISFGKYREMITFGLKKKTHENRQSWRHKFHIKQVCCRT